MYLITELNFNAVLFITNCVCRLFSSAVFTEFASFSQPEILSRPIDDLVLLLKSLGLTKVANFPFPNAPSRHAIVGAELHLHHLGKCPAVDFFFEKFRLRLIVFF